MINTNIDSYFNVSNFKTQHESQNTQDLLEISLNAHIKFMFPRIHNKWMKYGFEDAFRKNGVPCGVNLPNKYFEGKSMYYDMVYEIKNNLTERFETGYSIDYMDGITKL